jgi:preprotein translocase subunit SecE
VADKEEFDSTQPSGDSAADLSGGAHAMDPAEPAVAGVPADADEPTFRDRERLAAEGDDSEPDDVDAEPGLEGDSDKELVSVGAGAAEQQAAAAGESAAATRARQKKEKATPRQKQAVEKKSRTTPAQFVKESVSELQKVVYPTGQQLINYFIVVLIFVLFIIAIVSVLDLAFGKAIIAIFS